jgi:hypothetical protein
VIIAAMNAQFVHLNVWRCACVFATGVLDEHQLLEAAAVGFSCSWYSLISWICSILGCPQLYAMAA